MYYGYKEDGDKCLDFKDGKTCKGILYYPEAEGCSCHINPPCTACTSVKLTCPECGWKEKDPEPEEKPYKYVATEYAGLSQRVDKPRPLDKTKVDYRCKSHTGFSMIKEGVYPEHMTIKEVREEIDGTFGGRFEYFKAGKFKFIAYTD